MSDPCGHIRQGSAASSAAFGPALGMSSLAAYWSSVVTIGIEGRVQVDKVNAVRVQPPEDV